VTIIAYSPLEQGLLTGKFHENPELINSRTGPRKFLKQFQSSGLQKSAPVINELKTIGETHGKKPGQVALNWLVNFHGDTVVAIPGASKMQHAADAAGALDFELTPEELERLDRVSSSLR